MLKEKEFKETKRRKKNVLLPVVSITWFNIVYALTFIIGIFAKEIWDNINETGTINIRIPRLIAAIIISPITYAAICSKLIQNQLSLLGLAVAFQNGFFWQAVFSTIQKSPY